MINKRFGLIVGALSCALLSFGAVCASQTVQEVAAETINIDSPSVKGTWNSSNNTFTGDYFFYPSVAGNSTIYDFSSSGLDSFDFVENEGFYLFMPWSISLVDNVLVSCSCVYVTDLPSNTRTLDYWYSRNMYLPFGFYGDVRRIGGSSGYDFPVLYGWGNISMIVDDANLFKSTNEIFEIHYDYGYIYAVDIWTSFYGVVGTLPIFRQDILDYGNSLPSNYQFGYDDGYNTGYSVGYNIGRSSVSNEATGIMTLFASIANVPISVLNGLGGLVVWDVPIISILATFVIIALFAWVIRKFI